MFKSTRSYQRPENALKRATEFIDVNKPNRALEVLYEVIKRGKMRTNYSEKLLEPIMFKYLELCVDLKKSHLAKEGLYQYRNIFQSVNVSSLETVVRFYLKLADDRTESARKESHQAVVDIDDLDNLATPEEILLSAVSGEDAQDRSDRTILTPWVKFLWESYRQCLELLRTNSRVEKLYHNIAQQAFKFCEKYNRKTEFRKLCDNLRTHLSHIQKQQGSATAVNLNNPETQQMNLETRLEQLNYAIKMELWQEAYKAIEDISDLMKKSKKLPKPSVMASYYQKLGLVFWKADKYLFHAAALFKLFQLLRDQKKNVTAEEISRLASLVLVATLAIPLPSAHPEFDRFIETEKSALEKVDKLAMLLSLPKPPTRASLIKDLTKFNVVTAVPLNLQNMYHLMEFEFDPLHLCERMKEHLDFLAQTPAQKSDLSLPQYVVALKKMTITRLVKQAAQVYQTISFARLLKLSVFMEKKDLETILANLVRHNDLQIRIDHRADCIHFGLDLSESQREDLPEGPTLQALPSENIRCQLVQMSSSLQKCVALIAPESKKKEMEPMRTQTIQSYQQTKQRDHQKILQRQHIIEERKEMLENQNLEKEEQQRKAQEQQLKKQKDEELERLRREASKREKERQEEQMKQIQSKQIKDKLLQISKTSYGQKMIEKLDKDELLNLGPEEIMQRQVEELEKERKELNKKLKTQEKTVDYYERARRIVEIPKLKKSIEAQKEKDKEFWQVQEKEKLKKMQEEHKIALAHSKRLKRMTPDKESFMDKLKSARKSEMQKKLNDFNVKLETERKARMAERKAKRREERKEAYHRKKEEVEQQRREEELKKQREMEEQQEAERMKEEEEDMVRQQELKAQEKKQEQEEEEKSEPWRPKQAQTQWRQKEQEKLDEWRAKDDDRERERTPLSERLASRDIRQEAPPKEDSEEPQGREDWRGSRGSAPKEPEKERVESWRGSARKEEPRDRSPARDFNRGSRDTPKRDFDRGDKDRESDREFERGNTRDRDRELERGNTRDFERGNPRDRDNYYQRGPAKDRDIERGAPRDRDRDVARGAPRDGDRDIERGPTRDGDRGFEHGPPRDRDRDLERGPPRGDFNRGSQRDRDYDRGSQRDRDYDRGAQRDRGDFERGAPRDFNRGGPPRDRERGGQSRDFERGAPRDFERGGQSRDFERGAPRDFERGPPRDKYRDFERGPRGDFERGPRDRDFGSQRDRDIERVPARDREFVRGPVKDRDIERGAPSRDFERGSAKDREIERGPAKDRDIERGPASRGKDRDPVRGPPSRDVERVPSKDFDRSGSRSSGVTLRAGIDRDVSDPRGDRKVFEDAPSPSQNAWGPKEKKEDPKKLIKRPKEETDEDGWTKIGGKR